MVRVLGVDPGSHKTGWGVVAGAGSRFSYVASGTVVAGKGSLTERLCSIANELEAVIAKHAPSSLSIETIFHAKNSQSALRLGHARGVALLCAGRAGLAVHEYTAGQIKQASTGRGRAEKEQVQQMVRMILGLGDSMGLDESDALAAAICHLQLVDSADAIARAHPVAPKSKPSSLRRKVPR